MSNMDMIQVPLRTFEHPKQQLESAIVTSLKKQQQGCGFNRFRTDRYELVHLPNTTE